MHNFKKSVLVTGLLKKLIFWKNSWLDNLLLKLTDFYSTS